MSFTSFGVKPKIKKQAGSLKKAPIAEFAEPSYEQVEADAAPATPEERASQANDLQASGAEKAEAKDYSGAIKCWNRALLLTPDRGALHEMKSQVQLEVGQTWEAVQSASKAVETSPEWPDARVTLARAQLALGEPEAALKEMEAALALQPEHAEAAEEIGNVRMLVMRRKQEPGAAAERMKIV